jgi:hypothetical protein
MRKTNFIEESKTYSGLLCENGKECPDDLSNFPENQKDKNLSYDVGCNCFYSHMFCASKKMGVTQIVVPSDYKGVQQIVPVDSFKQ